MSQAADDKDEKHSNTSGRHSRQMEASMNQKNRELSHDSGQDDANEPSKPNIDEGEGDSKKSLREKDDSKTNLK